MTNSDPGIGTALAAVDWSAPWYAPVRVLGRATAARCVSGTPVADALNALRHALVRFVPQAALSAGTAYEAFIRAHREVPTRDNLHDFFNGLIWCALPQTKRRLNAIQAAEIARDGVQPTRGRVRDAATLFDENALLLHAPDALWDALATRDWAAAFGSQRALWAHSSAMVFGHAALEKLVHPYKAVTCHVWRVAPAFDPAGDLRVLDAWLAGEITPRRLAGQPFTALPVLGIPGWWRANEVSDFYEDDRVFRPPRRVVTCVSAKAGAEVHARARP